MLVHLDRSRIDVTGSFAYDLTTDKYLISTRHGDSGWRRRRKLRRKTRLEEKGGNASNMELWCNFPFPSTLCRVIYLSAHQPNLICAILSTAGEENKERKKEQVLSIHSIIYRYYSPSLNFFKTLLSRGKLERSSIQKDGGHFRNVSNDRMEGKRRGNKSEILGE